MTLNGVMAVILRYAVVFCVTDDEAATWELAMWAVLTFKFI